MAAFDLSSGRRRLLLLLLRPSSSFPLTRLVTMLRSRTASRFSSRPGKPPHNQETVLTFFDCYWQEELISGAMTSLPVLSQSPTLN